MTVHSLPSSDHIIDELSNSYYGYIVDFVLFLIGQLSKTVGEKEIFLLYLEERRSPLHEPPSPCPRHCWSPQTDIGKLFVTTLTFNLT